jgi:phosphoribosyl-ATP pyrophosphohydrolase
MENKDSLTRMYEVILDRKANPAEGSYTCYLFDKGLDKILKKVGEECAETIIAAKNDGDGSREELCGEVCDLLYHVLVMCAEKGLDISEILAENDRRAEKIGNLKQMKTVDRNT